MKKLLIILTAFLLVGCANVKKNTAMVVSTTDAEGKPSQEIATSANPTAEATEASAATEPTPAPRTNLVLDTMETHSLEYNGQTYDYLITIYEVPSSLPGKTYIVGNASFSAANGKTLNEIFPNHEDWEHVAKIMWNKEMVFDAQILAKYESIILYIEDNGLCDHDECLIDNQFIAYSESDPYPGSINIWSNDDGTGNIFQEIYNYNSSPTGCDVYERWTNTNNATDELYIVDNGESFVEGQYYPSGFGSCVEY